MAAKSFKLGKTNYILYGKEVLTADVAARTFHFFYTKPFLTLYTENDCIRIFHITFYKSFNAFLCVRGHNCRLSLKVKMLKITIHCNNGIYKQS